MPNPIPYNALQNLNDAVTYYSQNKPETKPETQNQGKAEGRGFLDSLMNNPNLGSLVTESVRTIQGVQNLRQGSASTDVNPCGKRPAFGFGKKFRERQDAWQQCTDSWVASQVNKGVPQPYVETQSRNLRPLYIGLAVVVIGVLGVVIYKKMNK